MVLMNTRGRCEKFALIAQREFMSKKKKTRSLILIWNGGSWTTEHLHFACLG